MEKHLDICRQVLDLQVVDANHYPCGKVDDIEVANGPTPRVVALLIGNGYASERLPDLPRAVSRWLFGDLAVRVPWSDVEVITHEVKLKRHAKDYGLDERAGKARRLVSKLPGAWKK